MRLSVIIPTFRRPSNLLRSLGALQRQTRLPDEVLVAIRDDDDETRAALAGFDAGVLSLRPVGVGLANASDARNRCVDLASGDVLVMTDDDTVAKPDWLAIIDDRFTADPSLGGLGGPDWLEGVATSPGERPEVVGSVQWWGRRIGNHHRGSRRPVEVEWLKGANMSFRREALHRRRFGHLLRGAAAQFAEDVAMSLDVAQAGWKLRYDPAVAVDHFRGDLTAGLDHRTLRDAVSLSDACHNETVAMLNYLPPLRRVVFFTWALLIGTRLLPGALIAVFLLFTGQQKDPLRRFMLAARARLEGLRTWRVARRAPAVAVPAAPPAVESNLAVPARICLVTHVVTPWDGQGKVNYELARYLLRRGHEVTLVASFVESALLRERGVRWIRIPTPGWAPHSIRWVVFALLVRLRLGARLERFDIVHVNGAIAPIRADINTSHFVHATWKRLLPHGGPRPLLDLWQRMVTLVSAVCERRAYAGAGRVVAVSDAVRGALCYDVGLPPQQSRVIYNGVDTVKFRPRLPADPSSLRQPLGLPNDAFVLLFVGDAKSPRKNLDLNLELIARLPDRFHLIVAGDVTGGPYPAMATKLGVRSRTHFIGTRRDVAECFRDADVVICASHYEPASLVLLEAMATGLPVLCSPGIGNATFIADRRNGYLLRAPSAVDQAATILSTLAADPDLCRRIGQAARETALGLSWHRMGEQYEELYYELIAERAAAAPRRSVAETAMAGAGPEPS